MSFQSTEDLYVTSLEEVFCGGALVAITMVVHAFGMLMVLRVNQVATNRIRNTTSLLTGLFPVILASSMIMLVHLTEVVVWAAFFVWQGAFPNASIAYYFSLNEYTTVGSIFDLPQRWRLLEGMIAISGLLTFAWSTGILITLAQAFQDQRLKLRQRRHGQRSTQATPDQN
jgi:hypothetical protein